MIWWPPFFFIDQVSIYLSGKKYISHLLALSFRNQSVF
jgi:hypothetical protein